MDRPRSPHAPARDVLQALSALVTRLRGAAPIVHQSQVSRPGQTVMPTSGTPPAKMAVRCAADSAPTGRGRALASVRRDPAGLARELIRALWRARATVALLILATIVEAVWLASQRIGFVNDSLLYYQLAGWLSGQDVPAIPTFITPGYPLLLVATGVTWLNTFAGLLFVQGAMAVVIPLLIYWSMRLIAPRVAFVTGLLAILLLVPFVWSKTVMSEQLYFFLQFAMIYFFARYLKCQQPRDVYLLAVCALGLLLTRRSANLLFLLAIGLVFVANPRQYRHHLLALLLVVVGITGWSNIRSLWAYDDLQGTPLDRFGLLMLREVYFGGTAPGRGPSHPVLRAEHGPASEAVVRSVRTFAREHPDAWVRRQPERDFGAYQSDPEAFATAVLTQGKKAYFPMLPLAVQTVYGATQGHGQETANWLLLQAAAETMRARPQLGLSFLWKRLAGSTTSVAGQGLFLHAYISGRFYGQGSVNDEPLPLVRPTNGPATEELVRMVSEYLEQYPEAWQTREPFEMFGQYKDDPNALIERIFARPHGGYWYFFWDVGDTMRGPDASAVFMGAAIEAFRLRSPSLMVFLDNALMFLMGPTVWFETGYRLSALQVPFLAVDGRGLPEALQAELGQSGGITVPPAMWRYWGYYGWLRLIVNPVLFLVAVMTFLYAWRSPARLAVLFLVGVVLYQAVVTSLFHSPLVRFVDATLLVLLMAAMAGVAAATCPSPALRATPESASQGA